MPCDGADAGTSSACWIEMLAAVSEDVGYTNVNVSEGTSTVKNKDELEPACRQQHGAKVASARVTPPTVSHHQLGSSEHCEPHRTPPLPSDTRRTPPLASDTSDSGSPDSFSTAASSPQNGPAAHGKTSLASNAATLPSVRSTLQYGDLEYIMDSYLMCQRRQEKQHFTSRPAHIGQECTGCVYVEGEGYSRRREYRYERCQTWKSSGGRIGSTTIDNGLPIPQLRIFRRKYGKIMPYAGKNTVAGVRFHKYVEIDTSTKVESGPVIYFVPASKQDVMQRARGDHRNIGSMSIGGAGAGGETNTKTSRTALKTPVLVGMHQFSDTDAKKPVLELNTDKPDQNFMSFANNQAAKGKIALSGAGGVQLSSTSGDFAEWHDQLDPFEELVEGDVVGFRDGKVSLTTTQCRILGVVSARPIVLGNANKRGKKKVVVAYCGRVPVRVQGPVSSGDVLVPSGKHDGCAVVQDIGTGPKDVALDCKQACSSPLPKEQACRVVGSVAVALENVITTDIVLVGSIVTPPAMTQEVMLDLNGESAAQSWKRWYGSGCFLLLIMSAISLIMFVDHTTPRQFVRPSTDAPLEQVTENDTHVSLAVYPTTTVAEPTTRPINNRMSANTEPFTGVGGVSAPHVFATTSPTMSPTTARNNVAQNVACSIGCVCGQPCAKRCMPGCVVDTAIDTCVDNGCPIGLQNRLKAYGAMDFSAQGGTNYARLCQEASIQKRCALSCNICPNNQPAPLTCFDDNSPTAWMSTYTCAQLYTMGWCDNKLQGSIHCAGTGFGQDRSCDEKITKHTQARCPGTCLFRCRGHTLDDSDAAVITLVKDHLAVASICRRSVVESSISLHLGATSGQVCMWKVTCPHGHAVMDATALNNKGTTRKDHVTVHDGGSTDYPQLALLTAVTPPNQPLVASGTSLFIVDRVGGRTNFLGSGSGSRFTAHLSCNGAGSWGFTQKPRSYCGQFIQVPQVLLTHKEAMSACAAYSTCTGIYDQNCANNGDYKLCTTPVISSSQGSCVYERGSNTPPTTDTPTAAPTAVQTAAVQTAAPTAVQTAAVQTAAPTAVHPTAHPTVGVTVAGNTCVYHSDGTCDEPMTNLQSSDAVFASDNVIALCDRGTDCTDCNTCPGGYPCLGVYCGINSTCTALGSVDYNCKCGDGMMGGGVNIACRERPIVGSFVMLTPDYKLYPHADAGLMEAGDVGVVTRADSCPIGRAAVCLQFQVFHSGIQYWYTEGAIQISPGDKTHKGCTCKKSWAEGGFKGCAAGQAHGCPSTPCDGDAAGSWCEIVPGSCVTTVLMTYDYCEALHIDPRVSGGGTMGAPIAVSMSEVDSIATGREGDFLLMNVSSIDLDSVNVGLF